MADVLNGSSQQCRTDTSDLTHCSHVQSKRIECVHVVTLRVRTCLARISVTSQNTISISFPLFPSNLVQRRNKQVITYCSPQLFVVEILCFCCKYSKPMTQICQCITAYVSHHFCHIIIPGISYLHKGWKAFGGTGPVSYTHLTLPTKA